MTIPTAAQCFTRHVTLHRFIRASDSAAAQRIGAVGLQLASGTLADPAVVVEEIAVQQQRVAPYRHAGEEDLWWVSVDVGAVLLAQSPRAADEAAHQLVTVSREASAADVFEYEIQVLGNSVLSVPHHAAVAAAA